MSVTAVLTGDGNMLKGGVYISMRLLDLTVVQVSAIGRSYRPPSRRADPVGVDELLLNHRQEGSLGVQALWRRKENKDRIGKRFEKSTEMIQ